MIKVERLSGLSKKEKEFIDMEFKKYATKKQINYNYDNFCFIAKEKDKVVGIISGKTIYNEVHISDLIVIEKYRGKGIGKALLKTVEEYFNGKGFKYISLTTYEFQAPKFYEKMDFTIEYVRKDVQNPLLNKYFLSKLIDRQH